ncbi:L protein [Mount Mabu Lophuromys virus 2]|uniref:RNA-directed RNA polymerase L n=1 Tax=Mount Mabu Lophuromys virus 2 TaxID=2116560 RepID=A0A2P1GJ92_9MONO|nr:L protein [Mount Mabu Lophuromys virus 2]AVM86027.1 L protein [Mount Mabu Lophuromys virus 2]
MDSSNISDVLYPECHLNSPIVSGKLISLLIKGEFPHRELLDDRTLIVNLHSNLSKYKRTVTCRDQLQLKAKLISYYPDLRKLNPIPYPYANKILFRITDQHLQKALQNVMEYANRCYKKISPRIVKLRDHVHAKLGVLSQMDRIESNKDARVILDLTQTHEGSPWYNPFLFWFTVKYQMRRLIKRSIKLRDRNYNTIFEHNSQNNLILINKNLCIIVTKKTDQIYYLTFEMVLMMCDVLEGRLMIDTSMKCDQRFSEFLPRGSNLWELIDSLFEDLGNDTYNIVAMIEPLVLGYLQLRDESDLLRGAFLDFCLKEICSELETHGYTDPKDVDLVMNSLCDIFSIDDIHMTAEFFSFFRTFGHPTLEAAEAANKVRAHMNNPKVIDFQVMMKGHAIFCGIIINGFRERHGGAWPPHKFSDHVSKRIRNLAANSEALTHEDCIQNWKSFVGFSFGCFLPLSLDEDLTMYMKDKALAAIRSEWDSVYPSENLSYKPPNQTTSRRLVEVFLTDNEFDPYNLINYVLSGDYLNDDEFNLSYSLKEKEIKKVGRLFAKMTYKMRACQVVGESLIATGVGKYFKENGMVKDEHELLKTLHKLSVSSVAKDNKLYKASEIHQLQSNGNHHYHLTHEKNGCEPNLDRSSSSKVLAGDVQYETMSTFLTTDLQKFCLNWRQETTNLFAERLNEIYGLPGFFGWLHKRLEKSVLYVADPYCPPNQKNHVDLDDVDNDQIFIKYPMGGIEGYCQKLWTIITIPFLFLSAYESGSRIAAVVQGDNQAIAITKRVHPNLPYKQKKLLCSQLAQQYFNRLRMNMAGIGHNLKANETIVSSHFFVYSKRIYYDGQVLSQSLKPISRAVFWSETIVDETRSACSNICTAISKSIEQGYNRWVGYSLSILKTLQQLCISLQFTINDSMTRDITTPLIQNPNWLIACSIIPSQLGGFNYMNISRLYVRNIGDPVTASLADIKRMIHVGLLHSNVLQKIIHQTPGESTYLDWASDPYSVNIPSSQSVTIMLKNITARLILQESGNPMLSGLFHSDFEQEDRDLARFLMDRPVIIPRAAHEIMDKSLTGARQEIAGMLDSTKGLIRNGLVAGGLRPKLIDKLSMYDYEQFRLFNNLMMINQTDDLITSENCSVELARLMRNRMWHHLTLGRPIYGLEVPDIIEAVNGFLIENCSDCYFCEAQNKEYCWFFVPNYCELDQVYKETNAIRVPYFGSTTEERSEIKLSSVRSSSRALKAAIRIATVYTWAFGDDDQSWEEAWYLSSFRANLTIDELKAITPISTSNNIAHRLRDKSTQMKYSGSSLNRVSRYTMISNDNLNFVIDGKKVDTNLIYQQVMLLGLSTLEDKFRYLRNTGEFNTVYHLHVEQNCCVVEMEDHPYLNTEYPIPVLHGVTNNRLIYDDNPLTEDDVNKIHTQMFLSNNLDFPRWSIKELNTVLAQSLANTIVEIITRDNKDHLTEFKVLANDDDINSLITEFLLVDPVEFSLNLGLSVAISWSYDIYYRRPNGKYHMSEILSTNMRITSKSYFNVLANALSHPKVFKRFWDVGLVEPIYGPNVNTQDYTRIAIDLIVTSYETYLDYWLEGNTLEFIMPESRDEIVNDRYDLIQSRHLCMLCCLYLDRKDMPKILGMTSIEKCSILTEHLANGRYTYHNYYTWNLDKLNIAVYPVSLTYLRRGSIKHIRVRKMIAYQDPIHEDPKIDPLNQKSFIIQKSINNGIDTNFKAFQAILLYSDDFRQLNGIEERVPTKNRWESHCRRRVGINSTSCYKAAEISLYILDKINLKGDRLFLGEGSGAMLTTYFMMLGPAKCYYNTGVVNTNLIGQRVFQIYPSEALLVDHNNPSDINIERHITVLFNGKPESTWIGDMQTFSYIMNSIEIESLSLVHNDMESSLEKSPDVIYQEQIHSMCLGYNLLDNHGIYIIKMAPREDDFTHQIINHLYDHFNEVTCFLPGYSNPSSPECYMVCSEKKSKGIIYPSMFPSNPTNHSLLKSRQISNNILDMKFNMAKYIKEDRKLYGDYLESSLLHLDEIEKSLLSYGFQINGPKLIRQVCGHDVSTGEGHLKGYINSAANEIVNYCDPKRDTSSFLEAYPLLRDSKLRELVNNLCFKLTIYILLYMKERGVIVRKTLIAGLRKKYLSLDIYNDCANSIIQKYLIKKLAKSNINRNWHYPLSTAEIKVWWKIVGYSMIHTSY